MAKVCMKRVPGYQSMYAPMGDDDAKALSSCDEIIFDLKKKRSAGNHRRYFAFIGKAFDMQEQHPTAEIFRKVLQLEAGHFDLAVTVEGKNVYLARSIKWDELDEAEFQKLFSEVVNAFLRVYGQALSDDQINEMVAF